MKILMILAIAAVIAAAVIVIEIYREVHHFCITHYTVQSSGLRGLEKEIKILFLSDLHNRAYGANNEKLLQAVRDESPDLILIGGDMLVGKAGVPYDSALEFVRQLPAVCPVYYANGNHEGRMKEYPEAYGYAYESYRQALTECGVRFLENDICHVTINGREIALCGLELPISTYRKFQKDQITADDITDFFVLSPCKGNGKSAENLPELQDEFKILLAHNPAYMDAYLDWGADLILSGHLHGGLVRVPGLGGIVTPQGFLFPKYSGEMTKEGEQTVIVSRGLGSHTLNIRLFNTPELISIRLKPR